MTIVYGVLVQLKDELKLDINNYISYSMQQYLHKESNREKKITRNKLCVHQAFQKYTQFL